MYKWIMAVLFFGGCIFGVGFLLFSPSDKLGEGVEEVKKKPAVLVAASDKSYEVYKKSTCVACHGTDLKGMPPAIPTLLGVGDKHDQDGIMKIIKEGLPSMAAQYDDNIKKGITDAQLTALAEWLGKQKAE